MIRRVLAVFWGSRLDVLARRGLLLVVLGIAVVVPMTAATVEYTARPQFCVSCHIMEPYYQSWLDSSHSNVSCVECHYEPGTLETAEGKFKALSQLAKYATRTQGTKPWAEVSDSSCMRSGCHSVRLLEGEVSFGRVSFDHRHHLVESRRGRRLRCVSCHSQIVQGEHLSVTESVCFMCHFMPLADGSLPPETSDCETCHGSPTEDIVVAGKAFSHTEYVARGVDCQECHSPVIEGSGTVRRERCHSCHAEVGHIERIGETDFLHDKHITEHKVECFECHDEIHHGLLPLKSHEPAASEGCGSCHSGSHGAAGQLYAGTGAVGVADAPSRMYETRVVCEACHTGRADRFRPRGAPGPAPGPHGGAPHGGELVAAAGNVDCIHCHGPAFDGMLGRWQTAVRGQLERLEPLLDELEQRLADDAEHPAREPYLEARQNVGLVSRDASGGAHNVTYALAALRAGAERIDRSRELLGLEAEAPAAAGFPFLSADGCSECHLGIEAQGPVEVHARPFSHERHLLEAGLDCSTCHSTTDHGAPAFDRADCASCHHQETEELDPWDCSSCHSLQESLLFGTLPGHEEHLTGMEEKDCDACHGEPPDLRTPTGKLCQLCHDETYPEMLESWRGGTEALVAELRSALRAGTAAGADPAALEQAREALSLVARDGSGGVHNFELVKAVLEEALAGLR